MREAPDYSGKSALVTGASGGIGGGFVAELLAAGAERVYAAARDKTRIAADDERVTPLAFDVTDERQTRAAAESLVGGLDLLVNSAGGATSLDIADGGVDDLVRDLHVHLLGPLRVTRAFLPKLEERRGTVLNVLSIAAVASMPNIEASAISKAAALSLTQAMRTQLGSREVRVAGVFPGPVDTPLIATLEIRKTDPREVAKATLGALAAGADYIFPDAGSEPVGEAWADGARAVERQFTAP
jgi:NAD(P)-dependent dehydrogenase (short-subunit alcohol dehydrogenase family)